MSLQPIDKRVISIERSVRKLFIICENIRNIISNNKFINDKNIIYVYFEEFKKTYDDIGAEESTIIFEDFYKKKRIQILSGQDTWLKERATIEYPSSKKTKKKKAILLSIFYKNAVDIATEAERAVTEFGHDEEAAHVYLPEELTYSLLEIFHTIAPPDDLPLLEKYLENVKSELPNTNVTPIPPKMPGNLGGMAGLGGLVSSVLGGIDLKGLSESFSKNMPKSEASDASEASGPSNPPSANEVTELIGKIFTNPKSKDVVNNVIGRFTEAKDYDGIKNAVTGLLSDTDLHNDVKTLLSNSKAVPEPVDETEVQQMMNEVEKCKEEIENELAKIEIQEVDL